MSGISWAWTFGGHGGDGGGGGRWVGGFQLSCRQRTTWGGADAGAENTWSAERLALSGHSVLLDTVYMQGYLLESRGILPTEDGRRPTFSVGDGGLGRRGDIARARYWDADCRVGSLCHQLFRATDRRSNI